MHLELKKYCDAERKYNKLPLSWKEYVDKRVDPVVDKFYTTDDAGFSPYDYNYKMLNDYI